VNWENAIKGGPFSAQHAAELIACLSKCDHGQLQWLRGYFAGIGINDQTVKPVQGNMHTGNTSNTMPASLFILYGTQTGNSEKLANALLKKSKSAGIDATVKNMALFKPRDFKTIKHLAVIVSTQGMGEPPIEAAELHTVLHSAKAPQLDGIHFSVLALGDTGYAQFCQTGKDFDIIFEKLGGTRLHDRKDCDVDYEEDAIAWMDAVLSKIQPAKVAQIQVAEIDRNRKSEQVTYSRKNPFAANLIDKINLNGRGSTKETLHVELNLSGSGITYSPGDALGVIASNSHVLVEALLQLTGLTGEELVISHTGEKKLFDALTFDYEISPLTALSLNRYHALTGSLLLKRTLASNEETIRYLHGRDVIDLIKEIPFKMDASALISILRKNTARLYSIASSQKAVDEEVHLLVSVLRYQSYSRMREGLCSSYLADRVATDHQLNVFVEDNTRFKLPSDASTPIIMIGPGTGVAPFRSFIQHREAVGATGKSWLFFGERNFTTDFFYQTEWQQYLKEGVLTQADVAFSRDTDSKVYVQHKLKARGKEVYQWLEEGAHLYVCGDAQNMAKDVEHTLREIIQTHGNLTTEKTDEYVKYLQLADRFQQDVY